MITVVLEVHEHWVSEWERERERRPVYIETEGPHISRWLTGKLCPLVNGQWVQTVWPGIKYKEQFNKVNIRHFFFFFVSTLSELGREREVRRSLPDWTISIAWSTLLWGWKFDWNSVGVRYIICAWENASHCIAVNSVGIKRLAVKRLGQYICRVNFLKDLAVNWQSHLTSLT